MSQIQSRSTGGRRVELLQSDSAGRAEPWRLYLKTSFLHFQGRHPCPHVYHSPQRLQAGWDGTRPSVWICMSVAITIVTNHRLNILTLSTKNNRVDSQSALPPSFRRHSWLLWHIMVLFLRFLTSGEAVNMEKIGIWPDGMFLSGVFFVIHGQHAQSYRCQ